MKGDGLTPEKAIVKDAFDSVAAGWQKVGEEARLYINDANFPDVVFKDYVKNQRIGVDVSPTINTTNDDWLTPAECEAVKTINIPNNFGIYDDKYLNLTNGLKGIGYFSNLTHMTLSGDYGVLARIPLLDFSKNKKLEVLNLNNGGEISWEELNLKGCTKLNTIKIELADTKNYKITLPSSKFPLKKFILPNNLSLYNENNYFIGCNVDRTNDEMTLSFDQNRYAAKVKVYPYSIFCIFINPDVPKPVLGEGALKINTTFDDNNLKTLVSNSFDMDFDGYLSNEEIANAKKLIEPALKGYWSFTGLSSLIALEELRLHWNNNKTTQEQIRQFTDEIKQVKNLKKITLEHCFEIKTLTLDNPNLKDATLWLTNLESFNAKSLLKLTNLYIACNRLGEGNKYFVYLDIAEINKDANIELHTSNIQDIRISGDQNITGLPGGPIKFEDNSVRVKQVANIEGYNKTINYINADYVPGADIFTVTAPKYSSSNDGKISVTDYANYEYSKSQDAQEWTPVPQEGITGESGNYYIRYKAEPKTVGEAKYTIPASKPAKVIIPKAAPENVTVTTDAGKTTGTISGVTADMEYSIENENNWKPITGTSVEGLSVGTYEVRYKGEEGVANSASASTKVKVFAANNLDTTLGKIVTENELINGTGLSVGTNNISFAVKSNTHGNGTMSGDDFTSSKAGAVTATATINEDGFGTSKVDFVINIAKATPKITIVPIDTIYYDGSPIVAAPESEGPGSDIIYQIDSVQSIKTADPVVTFYNDNNGTIGDEIVGEAPSQRGTYWIKVVIAGDDNYNAVKATKKFTIEAKAVPVTITFDAFSNQYNGESQIPKNIKVEATDKGTQIEASQYVISYSTDAAGEVAILPKNIKDAGTYYVVVKDKSSDDDVTITSTPTAFTIAPKEVTVSFEGNSFMYGAEVLAPTSKFMAGEEVVTGIPANEYTVKYKTDAAGNGQYENPVATAPTEVGNYQMVISDVENGN